MITMDEKIVGVWFVSTVPNKQDWMAGVRELEPDAKYELTYRFRYYKDDKVFDSEDKKNWYRAMLTGRTRSYVIASTREVARTLAEVNGQKMFELLNEDRDAERFHREFMKMPFAFMRMEEKEQR
jgi:hypothetical protein